jgi:hypothetical protein
VAKFRLNEQIEGQNKSVTEGGLQTRRITVIEEQEGMMIVGSGDKGEIWSVGVKDIEELV